MSSPTPSRTPSEDSGGKDPERGFRFNPENATVHFISLGSMRAFTLKDLRLAIKQLRDDDVPDEPYIVGGQDGDR